MSSTRPKILIVDDDADILTFYQDYFERRYALVKQHKLITAERELLEKTLSGTIRL